MSSTEKENEDTVSDEAVVSCTYVKDLKETDSESIGGSDAAATCASPAGEEGQDLNQVDGKGLEPQMSKKQLRRLEKNQRWQKHKHEIRAREKEKKKQRKKEAMERGEIIPPSRKRLKLNTMAKSSCSLNVVVDCSFDSYMSERDIMILGRQLQFCYSSNRRAPEPLQFHICGITGQLKTRLDTIGDYKNWDVHKHEQQYWEEFPKEDIVYLSGDSQNVLHDLDHSKIYIIGGLVDHNHHKGLCHRLADERGITHAQLPIGEYINMKTRKVLTVNHVFDILLHYTETKNWQQAFFTVIPQRKGLELKNGKDSKNFNANSKEDSQDSLDKVADLDKDCDDGDKSFDDVDKNCDDGDKSFDDVDKNCDSLCDKPDKSSESSPNNQSTQSELNSS